MNLPFCTVAVAIVAAIALPAQAGENARLAELSAVVPRAAAWAERSAADWHARGVPLSAAQRELARRVGVRAPERIRVLVVDVIPEPDEPILQAASAKIGLAPATASGMTLGYAVVVRREAQSDARLLSHEFRHVAQYEAAGGIGPFLAIHLPQLVERGYEDSPFEVDARAHEVGGR